VTTAWEATPRLTLTASTQIWWESDVWTHGDRVENTSQRRWSAGIGSTINPRESVRWTLGFSVDPWFDGTGNNTTAAVRATVGMWYAN
jgi:hypothetical protein